jgi:hypothetical protein
MLLWNVKIAFNYVSLFKVFKYSPSERMKRLRIRTCLLAKFDNIDANSLNIETVFCVWLIISFLIALSTFCLFS